MLSTRGIFDSELTFGDDFDFCLRMLRKTKLAYFNKTITKIRRHGGHYNADKLYIPNIKMVYKHLNEINNDASIKNKRPIISEWKRFLANTFFNEKDFKNAFYNYLSSAFYSPKKILNKTFCKQIVSCLLPKSLKDELKKSSLTSK